MPLDGRERQRRGMEQRNNNRLTVHRYRGRVLLFIRLDQPLCFFEHGATAETIHLVK